MSPNSRAALAALLCLDLLAPLAPAAAVTPVNNCKDSSGGECKKRSGPVTVEIGQPSSWSLAQAHYLLTQMHRTNRTLQTKMPTLDQLDPNRANASRLEILRTQLQLDAGFDQSVRLKNQIELQNFREKEEHKAQAQIQLQQRQNALQELDAELLALNQRIAVLTVQNDLADRARGDAPPSDADRQRKEELASLTVLRDTRQAQRTALQAEITSLSTTANETIAAPGVTAGSPPTSTPASGSTPTSPATAGGADSTALKDFTTQALKSFQTPPSIAASVALDNYLGMQYEIIAKQLTLLRDEAGPDERIVFFELPASIYTVDEWANDQIAQVQWRVAKIYEDMPSAEIACKSLRGQDSPVSLFKGLRSLSNAAESDCLRKVREDALEILLKDAPPDEGQNSDQKSNQKTRDMSDDQLQSWLEERKAFGAVKALGLDEPKSDFRYPITMEMLLDAYGTDETTKDPEMNPARARALEIIPRQSALNVNEYQATTKNTGFLGLLKLLSGFGAQLNFQRQKELYGDLLQQEVYASGFGKGTPSFGWTFGPHPGSRRLAPGQRTTYAVLAIPRKALAVRVVAEAWSFPRKVQPKEKHLVRRRSFLVRIPSEETERFWIKKAVYSPVPKGKATTVLIGGNSFSPQLGVLVNGVSLKRVISISRAESDEPEITFPETGVQGEFELTNSGNLILRFSMGKDFVGTPIITLVTPERISAINSLPIAVNSRHQSLIEASLREPMFIDDFKIETTLQKAKHNSIGAGTEGYRRIQEDLAKNCTPGKDFDFYRLTGTGLRPEADILIGDVPLEFVTMEELSKKIRNGLCQPGKPVHESLATQESTRSYLMYFQKPKESRWEVRYRQLTRQSFDEFRFEHVPPAAADFKSELRNYQFNRATKMGEADLTLSFPGNLSESSWPRICFHLPQRAPQPCSGIQRDQDGRFRAHCGIPADQGERDFVIFEVDAELKVEEAEKADPQKASSMPQRCPLVAQQGQATHAGKVEPKAWLFDLRLPVRPILQNVKPVPSVQPKTAVLQGLNFHRVTGVLFGNQPAVIDSAASVLPTHLIVGIPPKDVPAGEKEQVPIVLQTESGAIPTGFSFEYAGPPLKKAEKKKEE